MIRTIYKRSYEKTYLKVIWIALVFLALNFLIFLGFMNVCFENLVPGQPIPVIVICVIILALDLIIYVIITKKVFTIHNVVDLVIIICIILSFSLYRTIKNIVYLQIIALLKVKDIFSINSLVYELVKRYKVIFKTYVILKIVYCIIFAGHIIGCLFYALDLYLIKTQYFGPLNLNPSYYYQGELHAFSPIYQLSEQWRYVYAIYYSFSLLSTVAFGDIIGHNYIQDTMVSIFLILSTIAISLIIEQMYIVFRKQKTRYYDLITNIKYSSEFIKSQPDITNNFRHELLNYMITSQWKEINQVPRLELLTLKLQQSIFSSSILSRTDQKLPEVITKFYLPLIKTKYYPANYYIVDYNKLDNHIFGTIILHSKVNIGYTKQLYGKHYVKKQCMSFGFDELILNNNYLNNFLTIQLVEQAQVFVVSDDEFMEKMKQSKHYVNEFLPTPIEYYQSSKQEIMFKTYYKQQCSSCKIKGHTLMNCRKFHYQPSRIEIKRIHINKQNQQRKFQLRKKLKSVKNTSMKCLGQLKSGNSTIYFKIIGEALNKNNYVQNILSKTIEKTITNYSETANSLEVNKFQGYFEWKIYCPQGRLDH